MWEREDGWTLRWWLVGWWLSWAAAGGGGTAGGTTVGLGCEEAHIKCLYRTGCGTALRSYMVHCSALGSPSSRPHAPTACPEPCQHALIALMSSNEGKALMTCECGDERCRRTKERVEVCRPQVLRATQNETVVSCVVAQYICGADTPCSVALRYYHANCRSMFQGKRCSPRCKNSIDILRRQEKAAKLDSCICNGREEYDCLSIRRNMERLCFAKKPPHPTPSSKEEDISNEVISQQQEADEGSRHPPSWPIIYLSFLLFFRYS